jgi:hypothetical protein
VSPLGFCQVVIFVGWLNWACKRWSSNVERSVVARVEMVSNNWLGSMITCLLSFCPVSKLGQRDNGSAFMVFPGLCMRVILNSMRKGRYRVTH